MIFTVVIKPTHICNLACTYCYNDDVRDPIMREETLERVIAQSFIYAQQRLAQRATNFIWHGGEPMVAGLDYYEHVVALQKKYCGSTVYSNSIQTNGVLIKGDWLDFFKRENFSVSVSIDGPRPIHDTFRIDARGRGSYERVMAAIDRVQEAEIPLGVCVVVSRSNVDHMDAIFDLLTRKKLPFNIIPINKSGAARDSFDEVGLEPDEYARPWIKMFDRWFEADDDYVYCSDFVFKTRAIAAGRPADCIGVAQCSDTNISIDPVGDVFACATLSGHDETNYGNIVESSLCDLMDRSVASAFRHRLEDDQCSECKWQHVCHGGCQARSYKFFGDFNRRDYYCPSLFHIYEHIESRLSESGIAPGHQSRNIRTSNLEGERNVG